MRKCCRAARFYDFELRSPDLLEVLAIAEAAAVENILTDRRFHVEVVDLHGVRDQAAVERFGL